MTAEYAADPVGFKSSGVNFKLTLWDPKRNGPSADPSTRSRPSRGLDTEATRILPISADR